MLSISKRRLLLYYSIAELEKQRENGITKLVKRQNLGNLNHTMCHIGSTDDLYIESPFLK